MSVRLWKFLSSLKLTVVLLLLSTLLVFLGTLAQVHEGLWEAQTRWFKSFVVFKREGDPWWVPPVFTGGYTLGFSLLFNLIAAHLNRFQMRWSKAGIHLTHAGIILLLVGQLATDIFSRESFISFVEGETRADSESHRDVELVALAQADASGRERVVAFTENALHVGRELQSAEIPFRMVIREKGENCEVYAHSSVKESVGMVMTALGALESRYSSPEALPALAEQSLDNDGRASVWRRAVRQFGEDPRDLGAAVQRLIADPERAKRLVETLKTNFRNAMLTELRRVRPMEAANSQALARRYVAGEIAANRAIPADALPAASSQGAGQNYLLNKIPAGRGMDQRNTPFLVVEVFQGQDSKGTWMVSPWFRPQELTIDGKTFRIALRREIYTQDFSLTLLKTTHDVYAGTEIPKHFQSRVRLENPGKGEKRELDISMNNPLRHGGLTFYQHQMGRTELEGGKGTSSLQVVKNPSWITPYLGCAVVSLGMVWQFLYHLAGFVTRRRSSASTGQPVSATSGDTATVGNAQS
jgi:hypothetical protein